MLLKRSERIVAAAGSLVLVGAIKLAFCFSETEDYPIMVDQGIAYKQVATTYPLNLDYQNQKIASDFTKGELNEICPSGYRLAAKKSDNLSNTQEQQYNIEFDLYCWGDEQVSPALYSFVVGFGGEDHGLPLPFMFGNISHQKHMGENILGRIALGEKNAIPKKVESGKLVFYSFSTSERNTTINLTPNKTHLFEDINFTDFSKKLNESIPLIVSGYKAESALFVERDNNKSSWK